MTVAKLEVWDEKELLKPTTPSFALKSATRAAKKFTGSLKKEKNMKRSKQQPAKPLLFTISKFFQMEVKHNEQSTEHSCQAKRNRSRQRNQEAIHQQGRKIRARKPRHRRKIPRRNTFPRRKNQASQQCPKQRRSERSHGSNQQTARQNIQFANRHNQRNRQIRVNNLVKFFQKMEVKKSFGCKD